MAGTTTEQVKEKLDIVEFIKGYVTLTPAGKNFKGLCPFHREKTPSFMVSPERQSWRCFGCNVGGDVFTFLQRYENIEFGEALKILAEKAGVPLARLDPADYKFSGILYDLNNAAKDFFKKQLAAANITRKYLEERGLKQETIEEFDIGWAPNEPEALTMHFLKAGFQPDDIIRAGLAFKTERGLKIDRFRGRIMFPIHNHLGKVVGFTGRILPQLDNGTTGKYVNSPETPIFNKSKLLYGFFKSKDFIRQSQSAFLVEGQMDFLMSWQAGLKHAVASSGTALTGEHLRTLRRLCDSLCINFDSDDAGWQAGERAIDLAEAADFSVKVVLLKDYKDPAEAAAADPEYLKSAVANAKPAIAVYIEKYLPEGGVDFKDRAQLKNLRAVLGKIRQVASPVARSSWVQELSRFTGLQEKVLQQELDRIEISEGPEFTPLEEMPETAAPRFSRWEFVSQRVLSNALVRNALPGVPQDQLAPGYPKILELLRQGARRADDPALDGVLDLVVLRVEDLGEPEVAELHEQLKKEYLKDRRRQLSEAVRAAQAAGDEAAIQKNLQELSALPAD